MVAGEPLLRDDGTANDVPSFKDDDVEAGSCEVSRGDEAVVASADDDDFGLIDVGWGHGEVLNDWVWQDINTREFLAVRKSASFSAEG